jgi:hypothetical protein
LFLFFGQMAWARPNDPGSSDLFHYAAGDVVESFNSKGGSFKIWFTRSGVNGVPPDDADGDGIPDDVTEVAALYDQALALYQSLGFRSPISDAGNPDNGGDGRYDVYLLDFGGRSDGSFQTEVCNGDNQCSGYMVHQCNFAAYSYPSRDYGNRVLASHELFHAVQGAYDSSESSIVAEGTAVWATARFDPTLKDFQSFIPGYFNRTDHSLYVVLPGPVSDFSYGACIFFEFLDEKFGDAVIRDLWEASIGPPDWFSVLNGPLVLGQRQSSFADSFFTFARWNLFTASRANPMLAYAHASDYPLVKIETDPAPLSITSLRIFASAINYYAIAPAGRATMDASLVVPAGVDGSALRLAIAVRRGTAVSAPVLADASLRASAATDGATELLVVVANTAQSGESLKPGVCVGDPNEVDACRAQLGAAPPDMGMGGAHHGGCTYSGTPNSVPLSVFLIITIAFLRSKRSPL